MIFWDNDPLGGGGGLKKCLTIFRVYASFAMHSGTLQICNIGPDVYSRLKVISLYEL